MEKTKAFPKYSDSKGLIKRGLVDGVPIALGYLAVGFTIGLAAKNVKISALAGALMSTGMVASAGEYAAILLIGSSAGLIEIVTTMLVINLRYFLMSCYLTQKLDFRVPLWKRFILAQCVTDELFGISSAVPGSLNPVYTWAAALVSICGWTGGTVLGILVGNILPLRLANAMNVALYGMFIAIVLPPAGKDRFMAVLIVVSMAFSFVFTKIPYLDRISDGFRVIILTVLISAAAAIIKPLKEDEE